MKVKYEAYHRLWQAIDLLYPPVCAGCGSAGYRFCPECMRQCRPLTGLICQFCAQPILKGHETCANCRTNKPHYTRLTAWAVFENPVRLAIHKLKYERDLGLGEFFSTNICQTLERQGWNFDIVTPVPLSKHRQKERGYNQSSQISYPIALYFQVRHSPHGLIRIKETSSQVDLTHKERIANLKDAFLGNPATLKNKKVLVVDDVITTSTTMDQCAKAALIAGASQVFGVSIARSILAGKRG